MMDALGAIHVVFGLCALLTGTVVVLIRKGTRYHRTIGRWYFASMLGLNVTGLLIYRATGKFNFFHVSALFSLMCIFIGIGVVVLLRPRKAWLERHAYFMSGSYVGLIAAAASEVAARVPGWPLGAAVGLATTIVVFSGVYFMLRRTPLALERLRPRPHVRKEDSPG
jgi:uncharacterized membrane protein